MVQGQRARGGLGDEGSPTRSEGQQLDLLQRGGSGGIPPPDRPRGGAEPLLAGRRKFTNGTCELPADPVGKVNN